MMGNMMGSGWYGSNWDSMPDYMQQMMQSYWGGMRPFWGFTGLLDLAIKILFVVLLIAVIRWFWKKGGR